ncbi:MAG TPA: NAD-dependent epimerase/dehydratase family protein [Gammaproteobacteria bacterium]|jgi:hypothetical protein|nr:NAD-dependent epimerase/dehydratase family protein [Gammaproteobacteria bacterium]
MKVFLAGASGVIGQRLLPLMLAAGHQVAAMTRTAGKVPALRDAGATPVLCDVYDADALNAAVREFAPDLVMHQLTDLPDEFERIAALAAANNRMRSEGTQNLLAAARLAEAHHFVVQSIAWRMSPVIAAHEGCVLDAGGTVLRYGQFYGPGTYFGNEPPPHPRIHIDEAARRTLPFLAGPRGVFTIAESYD